MAQKTESKWQALRNFIDGYDSEKLAALKIYMAQKNIRLEDELEKSAEGLYNKTVPSNVRDYIAMKNNTKK